MDDLNYLFRRQQEERFRADAASCAAAREAHARLAHFYEERIDRLTRGRVAIGSDHRPPTLQ